MVIEALGTNEGGVCVACAVKTRWLKAELPIFKRWTGEKKYIFLKKFLKVSAREVGREL